MACDFRNIRKKFHSKISTYTVCVCIFNKFQPALVTFPTCSTESDVETYFQHLTDDSDLESDDEIL